MSDISYETWFALGCFVAVVVLAILTARENRKTERLIGEIRRGWGEHDEKRRDETNDAAR